MKPTYGNTQVGKKQVIAPTGVPTPPLRYSPAIRAGDYVFLSGQIASDFKNGLAAEAVVDPRRPYHELPITRQTNYMLRNIDTIMRAAGSSLDNLVRIDQFLTQRQAAPGYFAERDRFLTDERPASTCVEIAKLPVEGALLEIDTFGIVAGPGMERIAINTDKVPTPLGGYSLAIRAGDWVWTAGASPTSFRSRAPYPTAIGTAVAEEAQVDPNFWYEYEIPKQTEYVLRKLRHYLAAAGTDFDHVVKAQIYMADCRDYWGVQEVWQRTWPENPPATTIIPIDRMGMSGSRVEISLVAVMPDGKIDREIINAPKAPKPLMHSPQAIRAGNLLFLAGQMACDDKGKDPRAHVDHGLRLYAREAKREMDIMLEHVDRICQAAGGSLGSVAKTQLFYTDLEDLAVSFEPWEQAFPKEPPAASIVGVTGPHFVPDCRIAMDVFAAL